MLDPLSDHTRSPKDRRPVNRDSGYPTNHDRNNSDVSFVLQLHTYNTCRYNYFYFKIGFSNVIALIMRLLFCPNIEA